MGNKNFGNFLENIPEKLTWKNSLGRKISRAPFTINKTFTLVLIHNHEKKKNEKKLLFLFDDANSKCLTHPYLFDIQEFPLPPSINFSFWQDIMLREVAIHALVPSSPKNCIFLKKKKKKRDPTNSLSSIEKHTHTHTHTHTHNFFYLGLNF